MCIRCQHCNAPLNEAQDRLAGRFKSCPHCSQNDGREHIYYSNEKFGHTGRRVTHNNPTGIQSWCARCRGNEEGPYRDGIRCSELDN